MVNTTTHPTGIIFFQFILQCWNEILINGAEPELLLEVFFYLWEFGERMLLCTLYKNNLVYNLIIQLTVFEYILDVASVLGNF